MTRYRVTAPTVLAKTSDTALSGGQVMVTAYADDLLPVSVLPAEIERLLADRFVEPIDDGQGDELLPAA